MSLGVAMDAIGVAMISYDLTSHVLNGDYKGAAKAVAEDAVFWALGAGMGRMIAPLSEGALNLFSRKFFVSLEYGKAHDSTVLRENMLRVMGITGQPIFSGWQAHHIVGKGYEAGKKAFAILEKVGIDVNSPLNGVFLPGSKYYGRVGVKGLAVHSGGHNEAYAKYVLNQLEMAGGASASKAQIVNVLSGIREELTEGLLSLNKRGNI